MYYKFINDVQPSMTNLLSLSTNVIFEFILVIA
jgi:hypothetical protein